MNVGGLHSDSKSGMLHLHIDCCRVDMEGNTNDVHDIHLQAMKAAEIINMRHGWKQPQVIRNMRKVELAERCRSISVRSIPCLLMNGKKSVNATKNMMVAISVTMPSGSSS